MAQTLPFSFPQQNSYQNFRDALSKAEFTESSILQLLGIQDPASLGDQDTPLMRHRTRGGHPLNTLVRLFLIETPCNVSEVRNALAPMPIEPLIATGIIRAEGDEIMATIKLLPFKGLILAFDQPRMLLSANAAEYVMGIGSSSLTLANLTIRKRIHHALDLGTGCGIQALLAADHASRILATDRSHRSVHMAVFNSRLNGLDQIACREGDLFEPAREQKFDLIVSNPPFVISPETTYIYRDAGLKGDEICRRIVRQAPAFLEEGGFCQILCNWAEMIDQDWKVRLQSWFEGIGCDVFILRSESRDPATYASTWIRHTEKKDSHAYARRFADWITYYEKEGFQSIGAGLITLRRASGRPNWFRAAEAPEKMIGPCGNDVLLEFVLQDILKDMQTDADLLKIRPRVSPHARLERESIPSLNGWKDESIRLRKSQGFGYSVSIDPFVANMVVDSNGSRSIEELMIEMAHALDAAPEDIAPAFCSIIRGLLEKGFLLPSQFEEPNSTETDSRRP